jgi:selenocysteine-specific elongation factor
VPAPAAGAARGLRLFLRGIMIIATAGHIDHGKTTLVKALTGVDTDRLPEEKKRGISIDLGFAYWDTPDGATVGFVDVPGHERFVRNMLAGVCGIDYAMLVVAADDGVMPQTVEHLHIIDLLNVPRGIVALTKADRVPAERLHEVSAQIRALTAGTSLADATIVPVSAHSGQGVAGLRDTLAEATRAHHGQRSAGRNFRYAVDRAFTIAGSGTVVTGTIFDGTVTVGDRLVLSPRGTEVRIRGIQKNGQAARHANAGERCGLNLAGVGLEDVGRGDWVVAPLIHAPAQRLDVSLRLLNTEVAELKHWTPVHLHLGTAEVLARVAIGRGASVAPGACAVVQLRLESPVAALQGDRYILRDQAARRTLGGGLVIDPYAPRRRVDPALRAAQIDALAKGDAGDALRGLLECSPGGVDIGEFQRRHNLAPDRLDSLLRTAGVIEFGKTPRLGFPRAMVGAIGERVTAALEAQHGADPRFLGADIANVARRCAPRLPQPIFASMLRVLMHEKKLELNGSLVSLPRLRASVRSSDEALWQKVVPLLDGAGFKIPPLEEVAAAANIKQAVLEDMLYRKLRGGDVYLVGPGRFCPRATIARLVALAGDVANEQPGGQFTAAQFRDRCGVNRKLAIDILECMDRHGITVREGNVRVVRKGVALMEEEGHHV